MHDTDLTSAIVKSRADITLRDCASVHRGQHYSSRRAGAPVSPQTIDGRQLLASSPTGRYYSHWRLPIPMKRIWRCWLTASGSTPLVTTESTSQLMIPASAVTEEEINSEAALLRSRDVLEKVVLENGLEEKEKQSSLRRIFGRRSDSEYLSLAVLHLGKKLKIETPTKTNLINVSYASADPRTAYGVLNSLATLM